MAKSNEAVFPTKFRTLFATTTAAATYGDAAPVNTVALGTVGAEGADIARLQVTPRMGAVTAGVAILYGSNSAGATKRILAVVSIAANTSSATVAPKTIDFGFTKDSPLSLEAGIQLFVGTTVAFAPGYDWFAVLLDYTA